MSWDGILCRPDEDTRTARPEGSPQHVAALSARDFADPPPRSSGSERSPLPALGFAGLCSAQLSFFSFSFEYTIFSINHNPKKVFFFFFSEFFLSSNWVYWIWRKRYECVKFTLLKNKKKYRRTQKQ